MLNCYCYCPDDPKRMTHGLENDCWFHGEVDEDFLGGVDYEVCD